METGSRSGGFTLLEMLAVIVLMGMVMMIVYPRFELNEEKTEVLFIGRLVTSDVELIHGEALANREILTLHFSKDGYDYMIGESTVSRNFHRFDFKFAIPEEKPKEGTGTGILEGETAVAESQKPTGPAGEKTTGEGSSDQDPSGEEPTDQELNVPEIEFAANGGCSNFSMPWETEHFAGTLEVNENGEVKWAYAKRAKESKDSL